ASSDTITPLNDSSDFQNDSSFTKDLTRGESWQTFTSKLETKYKKEIESERKKQQIKERISEEISEESELEESDHSLEERVDVKIQSQLRPTQKSPKLFLIRVKTGNERNVFFRLRGEIDRISNPTTSVTQNSDFITETENQNEQISQTNKIFSIIYKESLPGYLYVESHSRQSVLNIIDNIRFIKKKYISAIPLDEMIEVLTFKEQTIIKGTWARVKKGNQKGEIGQIVQQLSPELVKIKFVPFIGNRRELMNIDLFKEKKIIKDEEFKINGQLYDKEGFLIRKMRISELKMNITPTIDEISIFKKNKNIQKGDTIEIEKGELKNIKGKVASISDSHVQILMKDPSQAENDFFKVTVPLDDIKKSHSLGDSVSVNDVNGVIVHLDQRDAIVAFDNFTREEKVPLTKLKKIGTTYQIKKNERRQRHKRDPILGKNVVITTKKYKGYQGTVKDVSRDKLLVELISNLNRIEVDRKDVILHTERGASPHRSPYKSPYSRSPRYTPDIQKTPGAISGYKTPNTISGYKTPSAISG
ncbi:RNA polymerase II transcription elongation factor DSIF/SUPT5H/SPT5, partial [Pseudoloma neurophilia]